MAEYTITVTLAEPSSERIDVSYTADLSADPEVHAAAAGDYLLGVSSGDARFMPGETSKTFKFIVRGDIVDEYTEYVVLSVSDGNGHSASTTVGILDEDPAPTLTAGGWWDAEGKDVDVWVTASHPTEKKHKVKLLLKGADEDGNLTAIKGVDFTDVTVTWDSEEGSGFSGAASLFNTAIHKSAKVPLVADDLDEGFEKFLVTAEVLEGDFIAGYGGWAHIAGIDLRGDLDQDGDRDADDNELEDDAVLVVPSDGQGAPITVFTGDIGSLFAQLEQYGTDNLLVAFTTDNTTAFSLTGGSSQGQTTIDWGAKIPITAVPSEIYVKAAEDASAVEATITAKVYWSTGAKVYAEDSIKASIGRDDNTIAGYVWFDENMDGIYDDTELPLEGVEIRLNHVMSGEVTLVQYAESDASGLYQFSNLTSGVYFISVLPGLSVTLPDEGNDSNDSDLRFEIFINENTIPNSSEPFLLHQLANELVQSNGKNIGAGIVGVPGWIFPAKSSAKLASSARKPAPENAGATQKLWKFQIGVDEAVVQKVHSAGTLRVVMEGGEVYVFVFDEVYLEAWTRPSQNKSPRGIVTDIHLSRPPGKLFEAVTGFSFEEVPVDDPVNDDVPINYYQLYLKHGNYRSLVKSWGYEETVIFDVEKVPRNAPLDTFFKKRVSSSFVVKKGNETIASVNNNPSYKIRYPVPGIEAPTLVLQNPAFRDIDKWTASWASGDRWSRSAMMPGVYK